MFLFRQFFTQHMMDVSAEGIKAIFGIRMNFSKFDWRLMCFAIQHQLTTQAFMPVLSNCINEVRTFDSFIKFAHFFAYAEVLVNTGMMLSQCLIEYTKSSKKPRPGQSVAHHQKLQLFSPNLSALTMK